MNDEPLKVGFHPPLQCARGRQDCRSLAQIISSSDSPTFICCGEVLDGATPVPQDQWSFCLGMIDAPHGRGYDFRCFVDRRDMSHMSAVLSMALAMAIPPDAALRRPPEAQEGDDG